MGFRRYAPATHLPSEYIHIGMSELALSCVKQTYMEGSASTVTGSWSEKPPLVTLSYQVLDLKAFKDTSNLKERMMEIGHNLLLLTLTDTLQLSYVSKKHFICVLILEDEVCMNNLTFPNIYSVYSKAKWMEMDTGRIAATCIITLSPLLHLLP